MNQDKPDDSSPRPDEAACAPAHYQGNSVIEFLEQKTGEAPRVSLQEEESATVSAPVINPSYKEKLSIPAGRGNYQIMGEIARGGMGVVLKGHDLDLGRDVAVKVLDKQLAERVDVVQRFVEEAQIGGQLQHPGIVPVYDLGMMADDRPYFTMKLVKGRTLATLLANRETPSSDRARMIDIFESVCQTMAYAHSRGVIHRDLKPANIMVGAFGEVQIVDWGLAKVLVRGGTADEKVARKAHVDMTILETVRSEGSGSGTGSMVGSILGTPSYMPPEQARGQVDRLDERADVFALGAILCEILTGLPPYMGERDEIIGAASLGETDEAFERLDGCQADEALIKLGKQCLMAAPAARPGDASVVADRVHTYVVSVEERAHKAAMKATAAGVRAEEERKARKLTLALGAAVVAIALIGGGGWLFVQNERAAQIRDEAARLQAIAEHQRQLTGEVNQALNAASVSSGAERWSEALASAERARALAQGGGAGSELMASVESVMKDLDRSIAEAREREELQLDTVRLLSELREVRLSDEATSGRLAQAFDFAQVHQDIFLAHGIDLDAGDLDSAVEQLTRRGLGPEISMVLDVWGGARRLASLEAGEAGLAEDPAGALRLLELAHLVDPDAQRAHLREALANSELEELRYLATQGYEEQPPSTIALLAMSLERLGDRETALSVYRAGVGQHPDDFELLFLLARSLTSGVDDPGVRKEMREAARYYQAALSLRPEDASVHYYVARIYSKQDEPQRALDQFRKAVDLSPDNGEFLFRQAQHESRQGFYEESRAHFEQTAEMEEPWWLRGWSLAFIAHDSARLGDFDAIPGLVREAWQSGASRDEPKRTYMVTPLVLLSGATGDETPMLQARRLFDPWAVTATSHNFLASIIVWEIGGFARDYPEVFTRAHLDDSIRAKTGFSVVPAAIPMLLSHAVELAEEAIVIEPSVPDYWSTLGTALYCMGESERAVSAFMKANELRREGNPTNWLCLAMAHYALGHEETARDWYDRAVASMAAKPDEDAQWCLREATRLLR